AELGSAVLFAEFAAAQQVRVGDPRVFPEREGDAGLKIGHQRILVDTVAVLEGVAVEEDVARYHTPLDAGEEVPAEPVGRTEVVGAGERGTDARRAVVGRQILAEAQR